MEMVNKMADVRPICTAEDPMPPGLPYHLWRHPENSFIGTDDRGDHIIQCKNCKREWKVDGPDY